MEGRNGTVVKVRRGGPDAIKGRGLIADALGGHRGRLAKPGGVVVRNRAVGDAQRARRVCPDHFERNDLGGIRGVWPISSVAASAGFLEDYSAPPGFHVVDGEWILGRFDAQEISLDVPE